MQLADDGFGNLIDASPAPPKGKTRVFAKVNQRLCSWLVESSNHVEAIHAVKDVLGDGIKPVLALIERKQGTAA